MCDGECTTSGEQLDSLDGASGLPSFRSEDKDIRAHPSFVRAATVKKLQTATDESVADRTFVMAPLHAGTALSGVDVACADFEGGGWVPIEKFLTAAPKNLLRYFYALPGLLSQLCLGRNYRGINAIKEVLPYETVLAVMKARALPGILRSRFTELMRNLHVDCDPLETISVPVFTRVWRDVALSISCAPAALVSRFEGLQVSCHLHYSTTYLIAQTL